MHLLVKASRSIGLECLPMHVPHVCPRACSGDERRVSDTLVGVRLQLVWPKFLRIGNRCFAAPAKERTAATSVEVNGGSSPSETDSSSSD